MGASLRVKEGERCYRFWEAEDSELDRWLFRRCFLWERGWVNEVLEFVFRQVVADPKSCSSGTLLGINERKNPKRRDHDRATPFPFGVDLHSLRQRQYRSIKKRNPC